MYLCAASLSQAGSTGFVHIGERLGQLCLPVVFVLARGYVAV